MQKTMEIASFADTPRKPRTLHNGPFEAIGGQVGHERVIAAHLDGEGTAFSTPSEPKRVPKEGQFGRLFWRRFLGHIGDVLLEVSCHEMDPTCVRKLGTC